MEIYYIGADVHCNNTELAIELRGQIYRRHSIPTDIRSIRQVLDGLGGQRHLTFEEGPMAGWLSRNLRSQVDELIVSDPRRNRLIACCGGDKNDRIDAGKLAALLRGGYLSAVYHSDDEQREALKRWVALYHCQVQEATGQINRLRAEARMLGMKIPAAALRNKADWQTWLCSLKNQDLAKRLAVLWLGLDTARTQAKMSRQQMIRQVKSYPIIRHWSEIPGIGVIRSITFFAYLDTPYRFKTKSKLWKYCGVGLIRETSGKDSRGRDKPGTLKLNWYCNKRLKNVIIGATLSAIRHNHNEFRRSYEQMIQNGTLPSNARHATARKLLTVMWGMWKNPSRWNGGCGLK
jgi:transposase